ncbi:MAG: lipopolysaccharide biosynthesis protein, partial [Flavobacteriales bacterium]
MLAKKEKSPINKVLRNSAILLSGDVGSNVFKLLTLAIFSHSQGADKLGYYVLFLSFIESIDRVFNLQTWQAFIKFAALFRAKKERQNIMMLLKYSFLVDLISLIVACSVAMLTSKFFISFFNIPEEYYISLLLLCSTIFFKILDISTGIFRLFNQFKVQAKIALYTSAVRLVLYVLVALFFSSFEMFIYATVLTQFISMIMKYFFVKSVLDDKKIKISDIFKQKINMTMFKELKVFSFIVYNNFDSALRLLTTQLDVFLLGKLYGSELVGIYKITKETSKLVMKLSSPVYQSIYPEFSKLIAKEEFMSAKKMAIQISKYAGLMGLVFYGLFYIFGKQLIILIFGFEMVEAYYVSLVYIGAVLLSLI